MESANLSGGGVCWEHFVDVDESLSHAVQCDRILDQGEISVGKKGAIYGRRVSDFLINRRRLAQAEVLDRAVRLHTVVG